jgi:hypothetical protein
MPETSIFIRGKVGVPSFYGQRIYGESKYGDEEILVLAKEYGQRIYGESKYGEILDLFGIWQVRHRRTHFLTSGEKETGELYNIRKRFYWPTNPRTEAQQAWRATFSSGVEAWQALSEGEKDEYRELAKEKPLSGFNLFLREFLTS